MKRESQNLFVEQAAELEHDRWIKWQKYLHSKCIKNADGSLTIPSVLVERWERQIKTKYSDLTEKEKDSDRKEAQKYIPIIEKLIPPSR